MSELSNQVDTYTVQSDNLRTPVNSQSNGMNSENINQSQSQTDYGIMLNELTRDRPIVDINKNLIEIDECSICLERVLHFIRYNMLAIPKTKCKHYVCVECLEKYYFRVRSNQAISCPLCLVLLKKTDYCILIFFPQNFDPKKSKSKIRI